MNTFLWRNNARFGPYPDTVLAEWLRAGTVSPDELGWREGASSAWQPLRELFAPPPAPAPDAASIYLTKNGTRYGPYPEAQVRAWFAAGQVSPEDVGWHAGLAGWQPLRELFPPPAPPPSNPVEGGLPAAAADPSPPPQPLPPPAPPPHSPPTPTPPSSGPSRMGRFLTQAGAMAASGQLADLAFQAARLVSAWQSGYRPMRPDPNAPIYRPTDPTVNPNTLPSRVDLRPYFTAVEDQGQVMSCTANAVAGAYEYWVKRHTQQDYDVSRLFIYYNARWRNGEQDRDAGSVIQLAMECLESFGACAERTWPYEPRLVTARPNGASFEEGTQFKIKEKQLVHQKLDDWRHCLAEGHPIVFGCKLFNSFDSCSQRGGVVPMPDPQDLGRRDHGSHAMCCVGYSDSEKVFIVRNSWGEGWGDKGYCYMPYNYLMSEQLTHTDNWTFVPCEQIPAPQDAWGHDDHPVTNAGQGVSFDTNPRPSSDYADAPPDPADPAIPEWHDDKPPELQQYEAHVEQGNFAQLENFDVQEVLARDDASDDAPADPDSGGSQPSEPTPAADADSPEPPSFETNSSADENGAAPDDAADDTLAPASTAEEASETPPPADDVDANADAGTEPPPDDAAEEATPENDAPAADDADNVEEGFPPGEEEAPPVEQEAPAEEEAAASSDESASDDAAQPSAPAEENSSDDEASAEPAVDEPPDEPEPVAEEPATPACVEEPPVESGNDAAPEESEQENRD